LTNVKLNGENPNVVKAPKKNGAKKTTKNLLFNIFNKIKSFLVMN